MGAVWEGYLGGFTVGPFPCGTHQGLAACPGGAAGPLIPRQPRRAADLPGGGGSSRREGGCRGRSIQQAGTAWQEGAGPRDGQGTMDGCLCSWWSLQCEGHS